MNPQVYFFLFYFLLVGSLGSLPVKAQHSPNNCYPAQKPIRITEKDIIVSSIALGKTRAWKTAPTALPTREVSFQVIGSRLLWNATLNHIKGYRIQYSKYGFEWRDMGRVSADKVQGQVYKYSIVKTGYYRLATIEEKPSFSKALFYKSEEDKIHASPDFLRYMESDTFLSKTDQRPARFLPLTPSGRREWSHT